MGPEVEKVPSTVPAEYEHLFNMDGRVEKCQALSIEELLLKIAVEGGKLHFARRVAYLDSRVLMQIEQLTISDGKSALYVQKTSLYLEGAAVACHVAAAFFGGQTNPAGGTFTALAQAFTSGASYKDKAMNSQIQTKEFAAQRSSSMFSDLTEQTRAAKNALEQDERTVDTVVNQERRMSEIMAGSS